MYNLNYTLTFINIIWSIWKYVYNTIIVVVFIKYYFTKKKCFVWKYYLKVLFTKKINGQRKYRPIEKFLYIYDNPLLVGNIVM